MNTFNQFFFGIFPYIALSIFFFGSLFRFDREQYSWKSDSSQLLYRGQLRLGNILFHVGILMVFFGHLFGLLTPVWFWDAIGISHSAKQMIAIVLGGVFGLMAMAGLLILLNRRLKSDRLAANATWRDKLIGADLADCHLGLGLAHHFCEPRPPRRPRNGKTDDLGAAHCHLPWRCRQLHCRCVAAV